MKYFLIAVMIFTISSQTASARVLPCLNALGSACGGGITSPGNPTKLPPITFDSASLNQADNAAVPVRPFQKKVNLNTIKALSNLEPGAGDSNLMNTNGIVDQTHFD